MSAEPDLGAETGAPSGRVERSARDTALHVLATYGLLVFGIALVVIFAILLPGTFAGIQTLRAILGNNTTVALLAMAEMLVIAGGNYDLSIAYSIGLMHIIAMGLLTWVGVPWPLVVIATILAGGLVGLDQRHPGRIRAHRFLHRDARRRHHPLRRWHVHHQRYPGRWRRAALHLRSSTTAASSVCRSRPTSLRSSRCFRGSHSNICRSDDSFTPSVRTAALPNSVASPAGGSSWAASFAVV